MISRPRTALAKPGILEMTLCFDQLWIDYGCGR